MTRGYPKAINSMWLRALTVTGCYGARHTPVQDGLYTPRACWRARSTPKQRPPLKQKELKKSDPDIGKLVGGFNLPLRKIWKSVGMIIPNMKKNIPNPQPALYIYIWPCMANNRYTNMSWILTNLRSRWITKTLQSVPSAHIGRVRGLCSRYLTGNAMCKWPVGTRATRKRYKVVPQWTKSLRWLVQSYFTRNYGDEIAI
jgi:hypothetical protein